MRNTLPKKITKPIKVLIRLKSYDYRVFTIYPSGKVTSIELEPGDVRSGKVPELKEENSKLLINAKRRFRHTFYSCKTYAETRDQFIERVKKWQDEFCLYYRELYDKQKDLRKSNSYPKILYVKTK